MELLMVGSFFSFPVPESLWARSANTIQYAEREWMLRPADLLLVQAKLPDGSGLEFCRWVQGLDASPCIIFQSADCDLPLAQALIDLPVFRLLRNNASPDELASAVSDAMASALQRENRHFEQVNRGFLSWRNGMNDAIALELFLQSGANLQDVIHGGLLPAEGAVTIIRIRILEWHLREHWPKVLVELALTHLGRHVLHGSWQHSPAVPMAPDTYALIIWGRDQIRTPPLSDALEELYRCFQKNLNCILSLQAETAEGLRQAPEKWRLLSSSDLALSSIEPGNQISPEVLLWIDLLKGKHPQDLTSHLHRYIASHWGGFPPTQEDLRQMYLQLLQAVDQATDGKKFWTEVLADPSRYDLYVHGNRSLDAFFALVNMTVQELTRLQDSPEITLAERVNFYLESHPEEDVTCADIAADFKTSPDHLNRLFRRETGETLKAYIIRTRLENARRLLLLTRMPVSQVAEKVGYTSFSHFSTAYKKRYGISPLETRRSAEG